MHIRRLLKYFSIGVPLGPNTLDESSTCRPCRRFVSDLEKKTQRVQRGARKKPETWLVGTPGSHLGSGILNFPQQCLLLVVLTFLLSHHRVDRPTSLASVCNGTTEAGNEVCPPTHPPNLSFRWERNKSLRPLAPPPASRRASIAPIGIDN